MGKIVSLNECFAFRIKFELSEDARCFLPSENIICQKGNLDNSVFDYGLVRAYKTSIQVYNRCS